MEAIVQDILKHELQDFAGAEIRGRLAIADGWVNEVLTDFVAAARTPETTVKREASPPAAAAANSELDLRRMLNWLDIRTLSYRTEAGHTVLDLEVGI